MGHVCPTPRRRSGHGENRTHRIRDGHGAAAGRGDIIVKALLGYVDPGVGATLAQLALAGTAGIVAAGRLRLKRLRRRSGSTEQPDERRPDVDEVVAPPG